MIYLIIALIIYIGIAWAKVNLKIDKHNQYRTRPLTKKQKLELNKNINQLKKEKK